MTFAIQDDSRQKGPVEVNFSVISPDGSDITRVQMPDGEWRDFVSIPILFTATKNGDYTLRAENALGEVGEATARIDFIYDERLPDEPAIDVEARFDQGAMVRVWISFMDGVQPTDDYKFIVENVTTGRTWETSEEYIDDDSIEYGMRYEYRAQVLTEVGMSEYPRSVPILLRPAAPVISVLPEGRESALAKIYIEPSIGADEYRYAVIEGE